MNKKVLIIEDDDDLSELLNLILDNSGCETLAIHEHKYKETVLAYSPSVILLDYWMDDIDGDVICFDLKNDERTKHIPIILVSAVPDLDEKALRCGADAWISKPFDISVLEVTVFEWLKHANKQTIRRSEVALQNLRSVA
jgi:DNA-binding response OmpR family regulator